MTMAAEIKNRVGPPAAAQPAAAGFYSEIRFLYLSDLYLYFYLYLWLYLYFPPLSTDSLLNFSFRCEYQFKTSGGKQGRWLLLEKVSRASPSFKLILCLRKKSVRFEFRRHVLKTSRNTILS